MSDENTSGAEGLAPSQGVQGSATQIGDPGFASDLTPGGPAGVETAASAGSENDQTVAGGQAESSTNQRTELDAFTLPDGYVRSEEELAAYKAWAQDQGLSQEQANAFLTLDATRSIPEQKAAEMRSQELDAQDKEWAETQKSDPAIGTNLQLANQRAKESLEVFGKYDLATVLSESGIGEHPGMKVLLNAVWHAIPLLKEDSTQVGGETRPSGSAQKSIYEKLAPEAAALQSGARS